MELKTATHEDLVLTGPRYIFFMVAICLAAFLQGLDFSIANVAIPSIAASFGVSSHEGTWVITLFAVSVALVLGLSGWLVTRYGAVKTVILAITLFTLSSAMCGLAWSFESLIFFRIVQGASAAPLVSLPQGLVIIHSPEKKRMLALATLVMILVLSPVVGPVVGGLLTDNYGWPWIFLINIPLGLFVIITLTITLRGKEHPTKKTPFDFIGIILLSFWIIPLQLLLDRGNDYDWFNSLFICVCGVFVVVFLVIFLCWNEYSDHPVIDNSFFRDPNFFVGTFLSSLFMLTIFGGTILIPLYIQTYKGYTPYLSGLTIMVIGILPVFLTPLVALAMKVISLRILISVGFFVMAWTNIWLSNLTPDAGMFQIMLPRFVQGIGVSLSIVPLMQLALSNVRKESTSSATGLYHFIRILLGGGGISTALYVTFWQRRTILHHSDLTEVMTPLREATVNGYHTLEKVTGDSAVIGQLLDNLVNYQASTIAFNELIWLSGIVLLIPLPLLLLCKDPISSKSH